MMKFSYNSFLIVFIAMLGLLNPITSQTYPCYESFLEDGIAYFNNNECDKALKEWNDALSCGGKPKNAQNEIDNWKRRNQAECGKPKDKDGDSFYDDIDRCPNSYSRTCSGCPDADGDNVADVDDNCDNEPGPAINNGCPDKPKTNDMVLIKGGTFNMGSTDSEAGSDEVVHQVTISDFYMCKYEVTVAQFKAFIDESGYAIDKAKDSYFWENGAWVQKSGIDWRHDVKGNLRPQSEYDHPVIHISYNDAIAYCKWLSGKSGKVYRLPTESEWEFAAGNGTKHTKYSWGNAEPTKELGNLNQFYQTTTKVGQFQSNSLGLYDMTGNVWEWCSDWYGTYPTGSTTNPQGASSGSDRVLRGGGWSSGAQYCRSANRRSNTPSSRDSFVGFRLVSQ
jgi:formylglycine-generating enzyme required for sulfatase activity